MYAHCLRKWTFQLCLCNHLFSDWGRPLCLLGSLNNMLNGNRYGFVVVTQSPWNKRTGEWLWASTERLWRVVRKCTAGNCKIDSSISRPVIDFWRPTKKQRTFQIAEWMVPWWMMWWKLTNLQSITWNVDSKVLGSENMCHTLLASCFATCSARLFLM